MTDQPSPQTDEEVFERWQLTPTTEAESDFADQFPRNRNVRLAFIGGVLTERERASAICDRIEALINACDLAGGDRDDVLELAKELRR